MSNLGAAIDDRPEWQKTLDAGVSAAGQVAPAIAFGPPGIMATEGAALAGGLGREPAPEPPPATLVTGPSGAKVPQAPTPGQAAQAVVSGPAGNGSLDALGAQAKKIGAVGAGAMRDASEASAAIEKASGVRKEAAQETATIEGQKAQAQTLGLDDQLREVMDYRKRYDDIQKGEAEAVKAAEAQHQEAVDDSKYAGVSSSRRKELQGILNSPGATDVQKASAKSELEKAQNIDPDQFLGSAGRKITAAIAMALGAFGSSLTGGPNQAMQIIQQAIQDNIDAQKSNFAKKERESIRSKEGIAEARNTSESAKRNALTDYSIGLEMAKKKVERQIAGLGDQEAVAKGKEMIAMIDTELAKNKLAVGQEGRSTFMQALTAQGGLMTNQANLEQQQRELAAKTAAGKGAPRIEGYVFSGKTVPTPPALDRAQKAQDVKLSGNGLLDEAIQLREKYGTEHGGGPVQARMEVLQSQLITMLGKMSDAGVIQPSEVERFQDAIGNLTGVGFVTDRLKALKWILNNGADAAARSAGFEPDGSSAIAGATERK